MQENIGENRKVLKIRQKAIEFVAIHPRLVMFGLSLAILSAVAIGFAAVTDPSHLVYAKGRIPTGI